MEDLAQWDGINGEVLEACSLLLSSIPKCWLNPLATHQGLKDHPEPKQVAWAPTQLPSCLSSSDLFLLEAGFLFLSGKTCLQKLAHKESKKRTLFPPTSLGISPGYPSNLNQNRPWLIMCAWGFHSPCIFQEITSCVITSKTTMTTTKNKL